MADKKLNAKELEALGGAFAAGYESERAKKYYQPGLSFTPTMDLALALGWPFLLQLEPPSSVKDKLAQVQARLEPLIPDRVWPADLVPTAVQVVLGDRDDADKLTPAAAKSALARKSFAPAELASALEEYFAKEFFAWVQPLWFIQAVEALGGGAVVATAMLDLLEKSAATDGQPWNRVNAVPWSVVRRLAYVVSRLSSEEAKPHRAHAGSLLGRALEKRPELLTADKSRLMPLRALAFATSNAEWMRSASTIGGALDMGGAVFLSRQDVLSTLKTRATPEPGEEASAEWVTVGGPEVLEIELGRWKGYGAQRDEREGHARVLEQYGVFKHEAAVAIVADMASSSAVKAEALAWLVRHRDFAEPALARISKSQSKAATSAEKALKTLAKTKPS